MPLWMVGKYPWTPFGWWGDSWEPPPPLLMVGPHTGIPIVVGVDSPGDSPGVIWSGVKCLMGPPQTWGGARTPEAAELALLTIGGPSGELSGHGAAGVCGVAVSCGLGKGYRPEGLSSELTGRTGRRVVGCSEKGRKGVEN